jgi:hypothetical protein
LGPEFLLRKNSEHWSIRLLYLLSVVDGVRDTELFSPSTAMKNTTRSAQSNSNPISKKIFPARMSTAPLLSEPRESVRQSFLEINRDLFQKTGPLPRVRFFSFAPKIELSQ